MKNKIFLIVGRTASGKDSLTNAVAEELGLKILCSYTTRPKRDYEGNTHIFISPEEVIQYQHKIVAYTCIGEYEYFSTIEQLQENDFYIVDPNGVHYLQESCKNQNIDFVVIYIYTPEEIRMSRALEKRKDKKDIFIRRNVNENEQFATFEQQHNWDYMIWNNNFNSAVQDFKQIIMRELGDI